MNNICLCREALFDNVEQKRLDLEIAIDKYVADLHPDIQHILRDHEAHVIRIGKKDDLYYYGTADCYDVFVEDKSPGDLEYDEVKHGYNG